MHSIYSLRPIDSICCPLSDASAYHHAVSYACSDDYKTKKITAAGPHADFFVGGGILFSKFD